MTKPTSPMDRPPMSVDVLKVRAIYEFLQIDPSFTLTKARAKYREAFGIPHDDQSIDKEYMWCVATHLGSHRLFSWCAPDVAIPLRIALALLLRESGVRKKRKGHKSQKTPLMLRLGEIAQMKEAQRLKSELMKKSATKTGRAFNAEVEAAETVSQEFVWRGRPHSFLSADQILERFKNPRRYGLSGVRERKS